MLEEQIFSTTNKLANIVNQSEELQQLCSGPWWLKYPMGTLAIGWVIEHAILPDRQSRTSHAEVAAQQERREKMVRTFSYGAGLIITVGADLIIRATL
ncbi:hypothetical protein KC909_05520 [Candidatus Dojkabacteria bacterium]|uniref:Uncharacterized protein n=1 Tax=Candidatus Dojkabacteria bacterium TaxID=2099670 RepID=A0A955L698_9BACT|nr:hypothetical protein [Candidatus Dojkabacteria bacterium]